MNVRIRRNFAFVQYESQEDATKALDATNMSKMLDRVISVEYAAWEDADKRGDYSPDRRDRDRSPDRRRRSPSPYKRERGSPDYGTGSSPAAYKRERGTPEYGNGSSRSPRRLQRSSLDYDRAQSPSPVVKNGPYLTTIVTAAVAAAAALVEERELGMGMVVTWAEAHIDEKRPAQTVSGDPRAQLTTPNLGKMVNMKVLWMTDIEVARLQLGKDHNLKFTAAWCLNDASSLVASPKSVMVD